MMPARLPPECVYVTSAAGRSYQEFRRCGVEEARRELTEILLGARLRSHEAGLPAEYRHRSRATQLEVTARVVREGGLLVVVAVHVREYR